MKFLKSFLVLLAAFVGLVVNVPQNFWRALSQPSPPGESSRFIQRKGVAFVAIVLGVTILALNVSLYAQIQRYKAYHEAAWVDQYGTNVFKLSRGAVPQVLIGTNLYEGVTLSTNIAMTNVHFLQIKGGVITRVATTP